MKTPSEFTKSLQDAILKSFPESTVEVSIRTGLGEPYCVVYFTLGKGSLEYANQIAENDNVIHKIMIYGFDAEGNPNDVLSVESNYGSFYTKSDNRMFAFGKIKTGWRNFKSDKRSTVVKIGKYFEKVKSLLQENFDKLTDDTQALMIKKSYIK